VRILTKEGKKQQLLSAAQTEPVAEVLQDDSVEVLSERHRELRRGLKRWVAEVDQQPSNHYAAGVLPAVEAAKKISKKHRLLLAAELHAAAGLLPEFNAAVRHLPKAFKKPRALSAAELESGIGLLPEVSSEVLPERRREQIDL